MQEFCRRAGIEDALGGPRGPQYIHVAGTNGKGSTTAYLQSILTEAGFMTGSFFSPYVVDYRERIQLGRQMIAEDDLADAASRLFPAADSLSSTEFGGVTKFEFEAGLGFLVWKEHRCEWVALEVGLGGRLDATNIVAPRCAIIVSIGLDHVNLLGETYAKIAAEKAGIIKPGVPVVVGTVPLEALEVIEQKASECCSPIWRFGREIELAGSGPSFAVSTPGRTTTKLVNGLEGAMQPHNAALAIAAIEAAGLVLDEEVVRAGVAAAYAPGRFQRVHFGGCELLLDGAHNRDAGVVLRRSLDEAFPDRPLHIVTNMLSGHDPVEFYRELADRIVSADVVPIEYARALPVGDAARVLQRLVATVRPHSTVRSGLDAACSAAGKEGLVVVTGSNYTVGAVSRLLKPDARYESRPA
jgi:dihydrofolate synthase/folylpolyglutamate synthase